MMLRGEIPKDVRPWVCGVSLMALRKPNNFICPVVVGETLRRLCSKVAIEFMGSSVLSILEPVQVACRRILAAKRWCTPPDSGPVPFETTLTGCWCS